MKRAITLKLPQIKVWFKFHSALLLLNLNSISIRGKCNFGDKGPFLRSCHIICNSFTFGKYCGHDCVWSH